jgi:hypothetical protein
MSEKMKDDIIFYTFIGSIALGFLTGLGYLVYTWVVI